MHDLIYNLRDFINVCGQLHDADVYANMTDGKELPQFVLGHFTHDLIKHCMVDHGLEDKILV